MIDENSTKPEVMEAVKRNGLWLKYASDELKSDREVVSVAVKENPYAVFYAGNGLS
jgi:hypothetical protein